MKAIEFLMKNQSDTASKWREEAEYRRKNARWLRYSAMIALQVRDRMSQIGTLRKVESGGGTKIEIWYQFTKTGTYKPKALTVKIKNSRRQLEFGTVTIGINPGEQLPLCVIKTPQGNNKNLTVRAGEKLEFSLCLQYALQLTQFTWELPKDSLFVQTKTYEFTQIKQREKLVSNELIPVSDFEWTPLLPGEINFISNHPPKNKDRRTNITNYKTPSIFT